MGLMAEWVQRNKFEQAWGNYTVVAVKVRDQWKFKARIGLGTFLDWPFATAQEARQCCEDDYTANNKDTLKSSQ